MNAIVVSDWGHEANQQSHSFHSVPFSSISDYPATLGSDQGRGETTVSEHRGKAIPHSFLHVISYLGDSTGLAEKRSAVLAKP